MTILNDVKHQSGLLPGDTSFDTDVIIHANTVFSILTQLAVGPPEGFQIEDGTEEWSLFYDDPRLNAIKSYVFLRVKLLFDPPTTGFTLAAYERQFAEMEFRLNSEVDF